MRFSLVRLSLVPAALVVIFSVCSCKEDDEDIDLKTKVEQTLTVSTWGVELFFNGDNQTDNFAGYTFLFNPDGTLSINGQHSGTWMMSVHDRNGAAVVLTCNGDDALLELSDTWRVIECRNDFVRMEDVGGGPGEINKINKLAFERTGSR